MTPAYVRLPVGMTTPDGGKEVACHGATVREVIDEAIAVEPRMRARIFREDGRIFAGVFLNGRNVNAAPQPPPPQWPAQLHSSGQSQPAGPESTAAA